MTATERARLRAALASETLTGALAELASGDAEELVRIHFEKLARALRTDALTGLPGTVRAEAGPAFAFVDLEDFRRCNRERGHAGGNEVLRRFAAGLDQRFPGRAHRVGGDEFVVGAEDEAALRRELEDWRPEAPWPFRYGTGTRCGDSAVVACGDEARFCFELDTTDHTEHTDR